MVSANTSLVVVWIGVAAIAGKDRPSSNHHHENTQKGPEDQIPCPVSEAAAYS